DPTGPKFESGSCHTGPRQDLQVPRDFQVARSKVLVPFWNSPCQCCRGPPPSALRRTAAGWAAHNRRGLEHADVLLLVDDRDLEVVADVSGDEGTRERSPSQNSGARDTVGGDSLVDHFQVVANRPDDVARGHARCCSEREEGAEREHGERHSQRNEDCDRG
ncbi:unnamed protein product, partial [Mycena citricolor]